MDRLASKTGGLFNLKEMTKAKEKRQVIERILEQYRQNCADQNISAYLFENDWQKRLDNTGLRDLKRELKLLEQTKAFTNNGRSRDMDKTK